MTDAPPSLKRLTQGLRSTAARWRRVLRRRLAGAGSPETAGARALEARVQALIQAGTFAEAEALCREGLAQFSDHRGLLGLAATAASRQHDWAGVAGWTEKLRSRHPQDAAGYKLGLRAARKRDDAAGVAAITEQAAARFPNEAWAGRAQAQLALDRRDWGAAASQAEALRRRFPGSTAGYDLGVQALFQKRAIDDARRLLDDGRRRFRDNPELKRLAERLGKWDAFVAADEPLRQASESAPSNAGAALRHAVHSDKFVRDFFGQPEEGLRRLEAANRRLPGQPALVAAHARALATLGRTDEAAAVIEASGLSATQPRVAAAWAELVIEAGDLDEGVRRYAQAAGRFPRDLAVQIGWVRAQVEAVKRDGVGRRREADVAAEAALTRFPDSEDLHDLHGWIAHYAGDHAAALERWKTALAKFPEAARGRLSFRTRVLDAALAAGATPPTMDAEPQVEKTHTLTETELAAHFQNLGSTVFGCEFGGVQRFYGAEPLHLMRWASCPIAQLIQLIEDDFEGFVDEADARLDVAVRPGAGNEYVLRSLRYQLRLDTFVPVSDAPLEQMTTQIRRRTNFLTRKLKEELARPDPADKSMFIYKAYDEHASDADVERLARALNRHGPATLLCVRRAGGSRVAGEVEWAGPNLLVGILPEFGKTALGVGMPTQYQAWMTLMTKAHRLWTEAQSPKGAVT